MDFEYPLAWYLRKSMDRQHLQRQIDQLLNFHERKNIPVPPQSLRFCDTGARDRSEKRPDFNRLLGLVQQGQVKTILIECLDRWGVKDIDEFFVFRAILLRNKCVLFSTDEEEGDLCAKDKRKIETLFDAIERSRREQRKLARRVRTGKSTRLLQGCFQGGYPPYGFAKVCFDQGYAHLRPDEIIAQKLFLWTLEYQTHHRRVCTYPDGRQVVFEGRKNHPAKNKFDFVRLYPSELPGRVEDVRLIFQLWTTQDISERGVAKHLNLLGRRMYENYWHPSHIKPILENPNYLGDLVYNRYKAGKFVEEVNGEVREIEEDKKLLTWKRDEREWQTVPNCHEALIDRSTFERAQVKLASGRASCKGGYQPPKAEKFWLKNFLRCGHCGGRMGGRSTAKGEATYFCRTAWASRVNTHPVRSCGHHSLRHSVIEKIIMDHFGDRLAGLVNAEDGSTLAKLSEEFRCRVDQAETEFQGQTKEADEFAVKLTVQKYKLNDNPNLPRHERMEYVLGQLTKKALAGKVRVEQIITSMEQLEREHIDRLKGTILNLRAEHKNLTLKWAKATPDQEAVLQAECRRLEHEMGELEKACVPMHERMRASRIELEQFKDHFIAAVTAVQESCKLAKAEALKVLLDHVRLHFAPKQRQQERVKLKEVEFVYPKGSTSDKGVWSLTIAVSPSPLARNSITPSRATIQSGK